jgi:Uri superfamily endonuclease
VAIDEGVEDAGVYCLVLRLIRSCMVEVGALGSYVFSSGWYVYTGSAKRNLSARLTRHLLRDKPLHWHVDHLRAVAGLERVWVWPWSPRMECKTNALIQALPGATIQIGRAHV